MYPGVIVGPSTTISPDLPGSTGVPSSSTTVTSVPKMGRPTVPSRPFVCRGVAVVICEADSVIP